MLSFLADENFDNTIIGVAELKDESGWNWDLPKLEIVNQEPNRML